VGEAGEGRLRGELIAGVTRCEVEVLELAAKGFTTSKIAKKLHKSSSTVKSQRTSVLRKLRARNMNQALVKAIELKIL